MEEQNIKYISEDMTEEKKYELFEKLTNSDKYIVISDDSNYGKNDHDFSHSQKIVFHSNYFKLWIIVSKGATGRKGKNKYFDIFKSNEKPTIESLNNLPVNGLPF